MFAVVIIAIGVILALTGHLLAGLVVLGLLAAILLLAAVL